jgi:chromosome segregation ATPase
VGLLKDLMRMATTAAGAVARYVTADRRRLEALERTVDGVALHIDEEARRNDARCQSIESRLATCESRLDEIPSLDEIVGAIQQQLSHTGTCIHERLSRQEEAIAVLKTTVAQTDQLLERILDSVESLRRGGAGHRDTAG